MDARGIQQQGEGAMIPYGHHSLDEDDIASVVSVLRSEFLTQGSIVPQFEQAICTQVSAQYGVAVNSATSALHIACLALDLGPGDIFWTSAISFVASANCGLYCGAEVDFVDIDPNTFNISVELLEDKLITACATGKLPKLLIVVHMAGRSCDMAPIKQLSDKYGFSIIEDASHALGAKYLNLPVGCGRYSDITVFSFHPVKIITSGEGGMAITNNPTIARKMQLLRSHGITRDPNEMLHHPKNSSYYEQVILGFNYRMTDIHAALGISQLKKLNSFVARRNQIAEVYEKNIESLPLKTQTRDLKCHSSYHLYIIQITSNNRESERNALFKHLLDKRIAPNLHYMPIMAHPFYRKLGLDVTKYPNATDYYRSSLSVPIFPGISESSLAYCVNSITSFFE